MCGRFTLTTNDYEHVAQALDADYEPADAIAYRPRFNVAPTDRHPILIAGAPGTRRRLVWGRWGFVGARDTALPRPRIHINARAETVASLGLFKYAFAQLRCGVVADGFYEWTGPKTARMPIRFHRKDERPFVLAAIATIRTDNSGGPALPHFAIVTALPNRVVATVHDRMPALLAAEDIDPWLHQRPADVEQRAWLDSLGSALGPAPDDELVATPASPRVNDVRNDDAECLLAPLRLF